MQYEVCGEPAFRQSHRTTVAAMLLLDAGENSDKTFVESMCPNTCLVLVRSQKPDIQT